ncbi:Integral membrane protein SED5 [Exophiala xenobiotica]|nr:Integral membrane protein SED5 [Exophiala xenobiotica]
MVSHSIQDRTNEFRTILAQAQKRQSATKGGPQRQSLLNEAQKREANGTPNGPSRGSRSEFARNAAQIGRGITATMGKLERLAQLAKRKAIFDDRPVEISELTYVIKQDLASLNSQISALQHLTQSQHPTASLPRSADQEGQHNKNVVLMLQNKVTDVAANFKDVLEVRTKNIQASRSRTENFVSSVSARSQTHLDDTRSESPLYQNSSRQRTPQMSTNDLLTLEPSNTSTLMRNGPQSEHQLLLMEEAQPTNMYIQERGQAIEAIERTINELGGIFGQLASMVSEQGEMLQRIDANTEDVVDNVQGAQRELLKYWNRVQGNRWLVAKMFGVLMIFFLFVANLVRNEMTSQSSASSHQIPPDKARHPAPDFGGHQANFTRPVKHESKELYEDLIAFVYMAVFWERRGNLQQSWMDIDRHGWVPSVLSVPTTCMVIFERRKRLAEQQWTWTVVD